MTRLTVGLASAVTFGALSALAGARALGVDAYLGLSLLALSLFGAALLLPVRSGEPARARPSEDEPPPPSAPRGRDKSPHPGSFRRA
jgi:hypothetical protein